MDTILFQKEKYIVGITKDGKYFESYSTLNQKNILGGAGLYIEKLQTENRKLKAAALKYEIAANLDRVLEILQKLKFVNDSEVWFESLAYDWLDSEPSDEDMTAVLKRLGY